MKLLETKNELQEQRSVPGLLNCNIKHTITSTTASMEYSGPFMPHEMWQEVLAFLKWVYDTTRSEGQVRSYVNTKLDTWKFWAYPQEARTGMSAKELDTDEMKKQREQFKDSEGWTYFGTVHSHCSAGAFQSSTDEQNERNQDGLHITIGHLDKDVYDFHARFYRALMKFEPNMAEFWDCGEPWNSAPHGVVNHDLMARLQMCTPEKDVKFPEQWRTNLIEVKRAEVQVYKGGLGGYFAHTPNVPGGGRELEVIKGNGDDKLDRPLTKKELHQLRNRPLWQRIEDAAKKVEEAFIITHGADCEDELMECVDFFKSTEAEIVLKVCELYDISPLDLDREFDKLTHLRNRQLGMMGYGID